MRMLILSGAVALAMPAALKAQAVTSPGVVRIATSDTLAQIFAAAQSGDTIVLKGSFGGVQLRDRSFTGLTIDARGASFAETVHLSGVTGINLVGGRYGIDGTSTATGRVLNIYNSRSITVTGATLRGGGTGIGLHVSGSNRVRVQDSDAQNFKVGFSIAGSSSSSFTNNSVSRSTSDGFNIANSRGITARGNSCTGFTPGVGAHPDCIQLWSLKDLPMQSYIRLLDNTAIGDMQGFTSFNPSSGSGGYLTISGNWVESTFPQGVACYGCWNSRIENNTLVTMDGARWKTNLNVVGGGNNIVRNNVFIDNRSGSAFGDFEIGAAALPVDYEAGLDDGLIDPVSALAVPEPASWAMLIAGFGMIGAARRRQRPSVAA